VNGYAGNVYRDEGTTRMCTKRETEGKASVPSVAHGHAETLLRSACDTICRNRSDLIAAMTLSLPADSDHNCEQLVVMAHSVAMEYGLLVEAQANGTHANVRLTRRNPPPPASVDR
jgi:hypothetical protein